MKARLTANRCRRGRCWLTVVAAVALVVVFSSWASLAAAHRLSPGRAERFLEARLAKRAAAINAGRRLIEGARAKTRGGAADCQRPSRSGHVHGVLCSYGMYVSVKGKGRYICGDARVRVVSGVAVPTRWP